MPGISRRTFLSANAVLLAGFGVSRALPASAATRTGTAVAGADAGAATDGNLALYRPVTVSSTAYGPNPAEFAVDRLAEQGVRGTGWRAGGADPQWIAVDLQAPCSVESVVLVFEATASDPEWVPASGGNPYSNTTGWEIMSSCPTAFQLDVSTDNATWTTVYETTTGTGGEVQIPLASPVTARWVRMTATQQSNGSPLQVNSFQVYGTSSSPRPPATGWTNWGSERPAPPPALATADDGTVPIESGWALTLGQWAGADGEVLSTAQADTAGWVPATVPGTVLASLVEQGHFPDPVGGFNNLHVPEALSRHSWWYRRAFQIPAGLDTGPGRHIWLEFDGINHHAEIWLNGTQVGEMTHPSARGAFDVTSALRTGGEQVLAVRITPMPHPGNPGDKGPDGSSFVNSSEVSLDFPSYISVSGWDWMPAVRDRVSGIWNHVRLRSTGDAVLGDPRVDTTLPGLPDTSVAEVTITVPVRNAGTGSRDITVGAAFGDVRVSSTVSVPAGASTEVTFDPADFPSLRISDPELWWPNGYGDPALHDLVMTASVSGVRGGSDRRVRRFGMRQVDYLLPPLVISAATDSGTQTENFPLQTARYLRLQCGQRATQWGDSIWTLSVFNSAAPGTDLALNKTATASSIDSTGDEPQNAVDGNPDTRWSSAYEDNQWIQVDFGAPVSFDQVVITWEQAYALNYVIQVSDDATTWTDVLSVSNAAEFRVSVNGVPVFCRGGNWGWDELLRRMLPDRMDDVMSLHRDMNFTMIRNWGGCSTRDEFYDGCDENGILVWSEFWEGDGLFPDEQHTNVFVAQAADTVLRYRIHPCIVVWCGANESFPPAAVDAGLSQAVSQNDPGVLYHSDSAANGTTSGGPYNWVDPTSYFSGVGGSGAFGFHTEIGLPTVSVADSMLGLIGDTPDPDADLPVYIDPATDSGPQTESFPLQHARYLRIQCYQRITGWGVSMWTLSVFNTASPGTDLALNTTATASSVDDPSRGPGNAVDGNPDTRWSSAYEDDQWIQVDFGSVAAFDQVAITWEDADALQYAIQVSDDGATWTDVKKVLNGGPWFLHDWCTRGNQQVNSYQDAIETRLGASVSLDEFCVKAQFVNYENIRAMFEAWNANLWNDASGLMLWMSNPAHHSTVWQTYDYDLDVNGTYYGARKGCEAVHVQASLTDWSVAVANHTTGTLDGATVTADLYDLSGSSLAAPVSQAVTVAPSSVAPVFTVPFDPGYPSPHLLRLRLTGTSGEVLSENVYWRYSSAQDMLAFNHLLQVPVSATARRIAGRDGRDRLAVTLANNGTAVAAMVVLSLRDEATGQRILPALYSDNYVWLLPGESRQITVSWRDTLQPAAPAVLVRGYNVPPVTSRA